MKKKFSVLIGTKNRVHELEYTLIKTKEILFRDDVEVILVDDGSTDQTADFVSKNYPNIILIRNDISKGILAVRNQLFSKATGEYVISLDDDTNFLTTNNLEIIENYFVKNKSCAVIAFRIYWSKIQLENFLHNDSIMPVKSFGAGANAMRLSAKKMIPQFPEWFIFYGEEDFASYCLFKLGWEVHYVPDILIHHRVDIKSRKNDKDYIHRTRLSLRSGWYLILMFYPIKRIPKVLTYTIWIQLKNKTFKGDFRATKGILLAVFDVFCNFKNIRNNNNRLSNKQYERFLCLDDTKLYWAPNQN